MAELTWDFAIDVPDGWYVWEPYPERRATSDAAQVDARIAASPELAPYRDHILGVLADFGASADARFAYAAATHWELVNGAPKVMHLMVAGGARHAPESNDAEIAHLVETLVKPGPADVGERAVYEVELPAAPAVRLRALMKAPDAGPGDPTVVLDTIQYWVPVPRRDEMIVVSAATPALGPRDDFAEIIAGIAHSLRFTYDLGAALTSRPATPPL
jgi:hypothetical protein